MKMLMRVAYVSGPYRDTRGEWYVTQNIRESEEVALGLWRIGYAAISPHKNTALFGGAVSGGDDVWLWGDLAILAKCDLIVMTERWQESSGAQSEHEFAMAMGVPIYYWPEDVHRLLTEALAAQDEQGG